MRPKWNVEAPSTIYTTDHLVRHLEQHPLPTNTTNIIMMGTNDIRKNMNSEAIKNIPKIQKHINEATIVSNIPTNIDLGNEEVNEENIEARITYNKHINNTFKRTIKTIELNKAMRTDPSTILKSDGFPPHSQRSKTPRDSMDKSSRGANRKHTKATRQNHHRCKIRTPYNLVGKEGKNLKTLKDKHNITITTSNDTNNNLMLTATGNPNNIQKAFTEIRTTIEIQQESDKELENKKSKYNGKQCRDFKSTGYCARGRSCWFSHEQENQTTTTTTTHRRDERNQQTPTTSTHRYDGRDNSRTRTEYQEKRRGDRYNRTPERENTHQKRRREQSRSRQESRNRQDQQRTRSQEFMYRDYRYNDTQQDRSRGRDRRWSPTPGIDGTNHL